MVRSASGPRVALVAGLRTPFVRQGTAFRTLTAVELGTAVVREVVMRSGLAPREIERVVFGQVVPSLAAPNIAREVVIDSGLPRDIDATSVVRACTTSYQTTIDLARAIATGDVDAGIAGGADSASDVPVPVSKKLAQALIRLARARTVADRLKAFRHLTPRDFLPEPPALAERSTGLTMGEHAEKMAQENGITRAAQDELAHRSHSLAARAWADGRYAEEVMTVYVPPRHEPVAEDNQVRRDTALADYSALRPVFDRRFGTLTAGNCSPLTDGASAVILMREDKARALGLPVLATLRSYATTALDPRGQMLMGPAYAIPRALDRAGIAFSDLGLVDLHEAFAAQVLSVTQALESRAWAAEHLGRGDAVGRIDWTRFNVMGGSIALGHPFAATGTRQLVQVARELRRRGGGLGLAAACAAGGLGAAIVVEVEP
jgi:acetyl-CoA acyltransferase